MGITLLDNPIIYVCDECNKMYSKPEILRGIERKYGYISEYEEEICPYCLSFTGHRDRKELSDTDFVEYLEGEDYWKLKKYIKQGKEREKKGDNN